MTEPQVSTLRVGHTERNAAVEALDQHLTAGRIDAEEYGERSARASLARTQNELDALFVDLPDPRPAVVPNQPAWRAPVPPGPPVRRPRRAVPVVVLLVGAWLAVCLVAGLVGHHWGFFFSWWIALMIIGRIGHGVGYGRNRQRKRERHNHW